MTLIARPASARTATSLLRLDSGAVLAQALVIATGQSLLITTLSLFLVRAVRASPFEIGLLYAVSAVSGLACDLAVALLSDRRGNRRSIIALTATVNAVGMGVYVVSRDYGVILASSVILLAVGSAALTQTIAYARDFSDGRGQDANFFNAAVRAMTSLAWVLGPPVGMVIVTRAGFSAVYAVTVALFLLGALLTLALPRLPPGPLQTLRTHCREVATSKPGRRVAPLLAGLSVLLVAEALYLSGAPLYLTARGLPITFIGWFFGLSAAIEIPMLLAVAKIARPIGRVRVVAAGAMISAVYYTLLGATDQWVPLLALQVLNATAIAATANLPLLLLQDMLPGRIGLASSLYVGALRIGSLVGGGLLGAILGTAGLMHLFSICALLALTGGTMLILVKDTTLSKRG